jgi:uncharacterized UBP type Zn finger protein
LTNRSSTHKSSSVFEFQFKTFVPFPISVQIDEATVSQLVDMGFPIEGCKKAVYHTGNAGVEPAMNWVMEHMEDAGTLIIMIIMF